MNKNQIILKFWTDKKYVPTGVKYIFMLYPFWGNIPEPDGSPDQNRFKDYCDNGKKYFKIVPTIREADYLLCPISYEMNMGREIAKEFSELAAKNKKRFILFFNSDSDEEIMLKKAIIFRTSFNKSTRKPNEFALPGWSQDYIKEFYKGILPIRKKEIMPVVGYCGYGRSFKKSMLLFISYLRGKLLISRFYDAQALRGRALNKLLKRQDICSNFIIRKDFWRGQGDKNRLRKDFINNLIGSDYILVTRGMGNFSYRFYETISCGRIPIFINTDSVLPFDHIIDYRKYCVWIEDKNINKIADVLLEFHQKITSEQFQKRQKEIRELYLEWLSPTGFYKNLWRCLKN